MENPAFNITQIKSVEISVDEVPVSVFKRTAVGGLLFGGIGAIAGALSSINSKPKSKISITVYFDSIDLSSLTIPCKNAGDANRLISTISNSETQLNPGKLKNKTVSNEAENSITDDSSLTGEITKLKKMLDEGIIDQEEFKILKKKFIE